MTTVVSDLEVTQTTHCTMSQQQQEQDVFGQCVESALSWIRAVQERLRANDNTEGSRAALETRLRETEVIRDSEHEGWVRVDMALVAAETLLQSSNEEIKSQTHTKLKELKAFWEETSTYIMHCHSRIEWVWLHWGEYLRAQEEFGAWLTRMQRTLGPHLELQLGAREKVWHLEHHRILLGNAHAQGPLLERLLEEATDLHERTQDPSMGPESRKSLQDAYTQIRDRAEERVSLLQKIAEEHAVFAASVQRFWVWLASVSEELTRYCDVEDPLEITLRPLQTEATPRNVAHPLQPEDTPENTICALQALCETVDREEAILRHLDGAAESVKERKRAALRSRAEYESRCETLRADASNLRLRIRQLDQELEPEGGERVEEEDEVLWRKYTNVRRALAAEEVQVEQLKAQLTELFRLSQDPAPLSDQVLATVKEYQGVKGRAFRLWTERETALRQVLLDPLRGFSKWSLLVTRILAASEEVTDPSHFSLLVQNMEKLLKDSQQLQEHLGQLQVKGDLLAGMFGPERAESLGAELSVAVREREKQHGQLLQRKSHLQGLLSRTKDFGDMYESVLKRLSLIREAFITTDTFQPDIPAKKTLSDQLMVILKDVEECEGHLTNLQTLDPPRPADLRKLNCLRAEWKELRKAVKRTRELPERELDLRRLEAGGQRVLARTSEEGKGQILQDLKHLRDSWKHLHMLSLDFHRLLIGNGVAGSDSCVTGSEGEGEQGQIVTEMKGWPGEEEHVFRKSGSEHDSGDYSEGTGQEKRTKCGGQDIGIEWGLSARDEDMGLGWGIRIEGGLSAGGHNETDSGLDQGKKPGWGLSLSQNPAELCREQSLRGHEASGSQAKAEIEEVGLGGGYSQSPTKDHRDGINQKSGGGIQIIYRELSGKERGKVTGDASLTQESFGTSVDQLGQHTQMDLMKTVIQADGVNLQEEFEVWLQAENAKLSRILSQKGALRAKVLRLKQKELEELRSRVGWGQSRLQEVLMSRSRVGPEPPGLEELRYRWVLYKSKLQDVGDLRAHLGCKDVTVLQKEPLRNIKKRSGLLQRACCVALPLQIILLSLLVLAFFLPLTDEGASCSLANNFARSFKLMLRYEGPPPT
ncbi:hypothetical protein AAFF_G00201410 [Aldrovandia affinis]|uniref:KASH domain-containing protein n=1 Tax=Aldrovandia affinis TaxID=143900 RepID=A0AAD7WV63_9TELE|nr:hypothetical protein AAFF_G00201410 [Aldrovandia affinis]